MKRILIVAGMLLASCTVMADTEVVDGIEWTYTVSDGEASVGSGSQYGAHAVPISTTGAIVIPSTLGGRPVTSIGSHAFYEFSGLTGVTIPEGVKSIGNSAFVYCIKLQEIRIPNSVTNIGEKAFYLCRQLWNVWIGDGIAEIGGQAFAGYEGAVDPGDGGYWYLQQREVHISDIGKWAGVHFGDSGANPMYNDNDRCSNTALYSDVERIVDLVIPEGVEIISDYAFQSVSCLNSITLPSSIKRIGLGAFYFYSSRDSDTGWCEVRISDLEKWVQIEFADSTANPLSVAGRLVLNGRAVTDLNILDGTTSIGAYAFYGCTNITSVVIPSSVTNIGAYAFGGCENLSSVQLPSTVCRLGANPFSGTAYWEQLSDGYVVVNGILLGYKGECPEILIVPQSTRAVADSAFRLKQVKSVVFPDSMVAIGEQAFYNCPLDSVVLPSGIKRVSKQAFYGQNQGDRVYYGSIGSVTATNVSDLVIEEGAFYGQPLSSVTISGDNVTIGKRAFYQTYDQGGSYRKDRWCSIRLVGSDIVIGDEAFSYWCFGYPYANLSGVTAIGHKAFEWFAPRNTASEGYRRPGYGIFVFSSSLKHIETDSFAWASIGRIYIENIDSIFNIDNWLAMCPDPTYYRIIRTCAAPTGWEDSWLYDGNNNIDMIEIPKGETKIPCNAFRSMRIGSITVPSSVRTIGNHAFYECSFLTNLLFYGDAPAIGNNAFGYAAQWINNCCLKVPKNSVGWDDDGDGKWQGFSLSYLYRLTTTATNGCVIGGEKELYGESESALLTAKANDKYEFTEWIGDVDDCEIKGNAICVPMNRNRHIEPHFARIWTMADALNVANLSFATGGDDPFWHIDSTLAHDGIMSMRSGAIGDSQTNWIETVVNGPGIISFWWKVSGECARNKKGAVIELYDYAEFTVDGLAVSEIGTESEWAVVTQIVETVGTHTLRWIYHKDESGSAGEDCAWLDQVVWIPEIPIPDLGEHPTAKQVAEALDGSADEKLAACITNAANYNAYRDWAESVKGTNGTKTAGAQAVKDSPNAWVSFALGSDKLLENPPTDDDLTVEKFEQSGEVGKFDFIVKVDGVNVGSEAQEENLKQVFGVEGSTSLDPDAFSYADVTLAFGTPKNGKVKFTAGPKDGNAATFFMKVKMK